MLPSPLLRRSPAGERNTASIHKRGRSFESALLRRPKDDDLILFNEMQNHERDNFLLHPSDDFDDSLTKLRHFSDFKFGLNIPARVGNNDLLNADSEKNDYDWLLTPPETPLFRSLDDDGPHPLNLSRGRTRSQSISIARPSLSQMAPRTTRSSASPHRLSPIPRPSYNGAQSRPRPSSVPRSSPPPILRSSTPTRRPSIPANVATPTSSSSTPTMHRMSTQLSGSSFSSGKRGASPVKPTRGNSASPKLRGWQTDLAGFPTDAPPNLRTSLSDRATSRTRGFSPASSTSSGRNSSMFGRKSTSPSPSRNASLSRSLERDNFSSYTRGSVASSGDDDADSMLSVKVGVPSNCAPRKFGAFANSKPGTLSKKTARSPTSNPALKKSFDSAIRQLDNRKTPQNMFRPLLSSVPATTFHVGKPSNVHRNMSSRNSSLTTSSNTSFEQGAIIAPELELTDHDQHHLAKDPQIEEEVFTFDKLDMVNDSTNHDTLTGNASNHEGNFNLNIKSQKLETCFQRIKEAKRACSKCGKKLLVEMDEIQYLCEECAAIDGISVSEELETAIIPTENESTSDREVQLHIISYELSASKSIQNILIEDECEQGACLSSGRSSIEFVMSAKEVHSCEDNIDCQEKESIGEFHGRCRSQQSELTALQGLKADNPEGTGISVLLMQASGSSKWPVVHGRTFSASTVVSSGPSYERENTDEVKQSFGRENSLASSPDLASSRQAEDCVMGQFSMRKDEMEVARTSCNVLIHNTCSNLETSANTTLPLHGKNESEDGTCSTSKSIENDDFGKDKRLGFEKHNINETGNSCGIELECSVAEHAVSSDDISVHPGTSNSAINLDSQSSIDLYDNLTTNSDGRNHSSWEYQCIEEKNLETEQSFSIPTPDSLSVVDDLVLTYSGCQDGVSDDSAHTYLVNSQNHEIKKCCKEDLMNESMAAQVPNDSEIFQEAYDSTKSDGHDMLPTENKGILAITEETFVSEHLADEELSTMVEAPKKTMQRSFTLEEATDTVLFCSSIVHDIAYKAVTIGMEKELSLPEALRPTVAIYGKSVSNQDLRNISSKRIQSSRKVKRKRPEIDIKVPHIEPGDRAKVPESAHTNTKVINTVDSTKPPKLESKCNCSVM